MTILGVDEHIWRPSRIGDADRAATGMVDLTRDKRGNLHTRLLEVVPARRGTAYAAWIKDQLAEFIADVRQASLSRFRGYANAIPTRSPC